MNKSKISNAIRTLWADYRNYDYLEPSYLTKMASYLEEALAEGPVASAEAEEVVSRAISALYRDASDNDFVEDNYLKVLANHLEKALP